MDAPEEDLDAKIARLAAALREREQLGPRRAGITAAITQVTGELNELRSRLAAEEQDVGRLEGFSVGRVLATLRGVHGRSLEKELGEAEQARERVAEAHNRLDVLHSQLAQVTARLEATSTAPATYAAALAERERRLREAGDGPGRRLAGLAAEREEVRADLHRLQWLASIAGRAAEALREANELLESADGWSSVDTFLGGGAVSSHVKHERMDEAAGHLAGAERLLRALRDELGAGDLGTPAGPEVGDTTRLVDVFFDNIFTDLDVRSRIDEGLAQVGRAAVRVRDLRTSLAAQLSERRAELRTIEAERAKLLGSGVEDA
ncbi:hypothetical protein [Actinoplanes aureus]|uniref:Uncharacterized protein n=1 Tax=Actinoplanes aureus TaxID=2792083 RepID=A0A931CIZ4_9ACTN|nr:hypothetical protein [Actinoplanes aureus]MBG0567981.1 hypothetical protein [Actinoplanes aureus]